MMEQNTEVAQEVPEQPKAEPVKEDIVSPKLGLVARKERAVVQKMQEFQRQKQEFEKERQQLLEELTQKKQWEELFTKNPLEALKAKGMDYQKLTEHALGEDLTPQTVEKKMEERLAQLERRLQEEKEQTLKQQEEMQLKQEQEVIENFKSELKDFVSSKADTYSLTGLFDGDAELVFDTIDAYYTEHGKVLSNEEAVGLVEKYFVKKYEEAHAIMSKRNQAQAEETEKKELGVAPARKPSQTTLTNSMNNVSAGASYLPPKTEADRLRRAMAALDGNNK